MMTIWFSNDNFRNPDSCRGSNIGNEQDKEVSWNLRFPHRTLGGGHMSLPTQHNPVSLCLSTDSHATHSLGTSLQFSQALTHIAGNDKVSKLSTA